MFEQFPFLYSQTAFDWVALVLLCSAVYFVLRAAYAVYMNFATELPKDATLAFVVCLLSICLLLFLVSTSPPSELVKEETLTVEIFRVSELKRSHHISLKDVSTGVVYSPEIFNLHVTADKLAVGRRLEVKHEIWYNPARKTYLNGWPDLREVLKH
ncbi:MAG: hypothetical protein K2W82_15760 [Candidatus Obscuribacterales bacterium]|nr:hypothetical protein [Candidatus Obscuribacterales bacterium]